MRILKSYTYFRIPNIFCPCVCLATDAATCILGIINKLSVKNKAADAVAAAFVLLNVQVLYRRI